jgi:hypothetical protein
MLAPDARVSMGPQAARASLREARLSALVLSIGLAIAGCGGANDPANSAWIAPTGGQKNVSSGSALELYFPLVDGNVYFYATQNEMGEPGLLVARVYRADATHGELRFPSGSKRFEFTSDGVLYQSRLGTTYVLKAPLEVGTTWRGEHGGQTRILATKVNVDVPAGKFTGCIQTIEERLGDAPVKYATTFCPTVGVVVLEAASGANLERAELKSYGAPNDLGPDGTTKFRVNPDAQPPPVLTPPRP